ncbi:Sec-independent protein translocase protein TatB (plasmid) [Acinetobacter variabilis]|mgnify:CR=1 FL=1|jgi:sec-independent protein translocase protein TatB|uniref:Sec-independent protein translocase protein TatB n=2 Tax=Acinetobacter TaxID=469 RepID=N9M8N9_9GAMM|nr:MULTISPECIES: Sec-independent protein translocase protein TatB [Acinetobacter]EXA63816.1 twin arginine-targeting protein translocase TatB [Acinetobacter baumannii 348935]HAB43084.1 twin-arginine translocase subunit TatB [Acinetobacter sp.]AUX91545.1 twin-arginine translocase subunit TatB [Acinetobacter sp. ACNIH1]ENV14647.1 twin arginine-targeting protein translocase TatB [Acinetobacter schindleri NIPH 900]ENX04903.1 twin arginine-targeting protein translocase TatB [Acinetobacter variabilis
MLNIGMTELLVFGAIALLILGPDKLPEAIRFIGKWSAKIKRIAGNIQNDLDRELRLSELREQMQSELKRIQELEIKMQAQMDNINVIHQPIIRNPEQHLLNYELTYQLINESVSPVHLPPIQLNKVTKQEKIYADIKVAV